MGIVSALKIEVSSTMISSGSDTRQAVSLSLSSEAPSSSVLSAVCLDSFSMASKTSPLLPTVFGTVVLGHIGVRADNMEATVDPLDGPTILDRGTSRYSFTERFNAVSPGIEAEGIITPITVTRPTSPGEFVRDAITVRRRLEFAALLRVEVIMETLSGYSVV